MFVLDDLVHLSASEITSIHDAILDRYPGLKGVRKDLSVEALVGRIHANLSYESQTFQSIVNVAALYAEVIARGHVFNDGNKRTAVVSMLSFLDLNGYKLTADQDQLADRIVELSEGKNNYRGFSTWLGPKISAC